MGHADFRINLTLGPEMTVNGTDCLNSYCPMVSFLIFEWAFPAFIFG